MSYTKLQIEQLLRNGVWKIPNGSKKGKKYSEGSIKSCNNVIDWAYKKVFHKNTTIPMTFDMVLKAYDAALIDAYIKNPLSPNTRRTSTFRLILQMFNK